MTAETITQRYVVEKWITENGEVQWYVADLDEDRDIFRYDNEAYAIAATDTLNEYPETEAPGD